MKVYIFERKKDKKRLYPLTYITHTSNLLCGIHTIKDKWMTYLNDDIKELTICDIDDYKLKNKEEKQMWINAIFLPDNELANTIKNLKFGECLSYRENVIAFVIDVDKKISKTIKYKGKLKVLIHHYDLLYYNSHELHIDFKTLKTELISSENNGKNTIINEEQVIISPTAKVFNTVLDATNGPIYIDKKASVLPFTYIQGPAYVGIHTQVRPHTIIRGGSSIGNHCVVGGEIKQTIIQSYSNKAHYGYLGNSIIGKWCNLGAGTTSSNTKNNFGHIKIYDHINKKNISSGLQHLGVIMGDHCMCGINTSINSGTIMGIGTTVHTQGFLPKYIAPFCWNTLKQSSITFEEYRIDKFIEMVRNMFKDKSMVASDDYLKILSDTFNDNKEERNNFIE